MTSSYVIAYDIGTTGVKTCLFEISGAVRLLASATADYPLYVLDNGGVEQEPEDWWQAMCRTTENIFEKSEIPKTAVAGISFCAQMQSVVLVDRDGVPVRRSMNYMDSRSTEEIKNGIMHGIRFSGMNLRKLLRSIRISGAVSASVKDPVWKYNWVKNKEPEAFARVHKWLDVKDYLVFKACGKFVMSEDSAFATLLYDTRTGRKCFSAELCRLMGVKFEHLPEICRSTDMAGVITAQASSELGIPAGVAVFAGGGDASLIGVGAGAVSEGDTHIYMGTSGWVSTVVKKQTLSIQSMIASIVGADPHHFNFFAELETAGKCLEWVRDHLALDEIGLFLEKRLVCDEPECLHKGLYDYMTHVIQEVPAGSNGVIFTPWLHGNRCPFEDPNARGMFFNIGLETGKRDLIHAVLEGVCYHLRWQLEAIEKHAKTSPSIRLVGGGALAPLTCQILADILNRHVEVVDHPQNVGSVGAAIVAAVGLGLIDGIEDAKGLIPVTGRYSPKEDHVKIYNQYFPVFRSLYQNNAKAFKALNAGK